ncbi:unnamed protein product [Alternaria alternata]
MFYGLQLMDAPGGDRIKKAYMKVLESVPAWLESPSDTSVDIHTAALSAWTAMTCHDYQLAWKFHCKSCQHVKSNGIDQLDVIPAKSFEEESRKDTDRYTYWYILSIDTFFRLFYDKPTVLQYVPNKVRPPLLFRSDNMHPSALNVIMSAVWIRYTLLTAEMISYVDSHQTPDQDETVSQKIDETCLQMEALMDEWKLHEMMNAADTSDEVRCLVADHIMNIYATIIGLQRLVRHQQARPGSKDIALRAARRVLNTILDFYNTPSLNIKFTSITDHKPEDCESDIQILENIGAAMAQSGTQRRDLVPFERTINALNRVSRSLQEERRKESMLIETREHVAQETDLPPTSFDTIQNLMASELPDIDMSNFSSMPDYTPNMDGDFQSLGFFRAIENDFVARNWQTDWWDLGGGADIGMSQFPDTHPPDFAYQAPNTPQPSREDTFAKADAARLILIGRTESTLEETKKLLAGSKSECAVYPVSATDETAMYDIAKQVGAWDVLVLAAAHISSPSKIVEASLQDWWADYETNVKSIVIASQAFVPSAKPGAALYTLAAGAAALPPAYTPGLSGYLVSKTAQTKIVEFLAAENPDLFACAVHPGMVDTGIFRGSGADPSQLPMDSVDLSANFLVWLSQPKTKFLSGKMVWANWDVEELEARQDEIKGSSMMTVGLEGWPYSPAAPK